MEFFVKGDEMKLRVLIIIIGILFRGMNACDHGENKVPEKLSITRNNVTRLENNLCILFKCRTFDEEGSVLYVAVFKKSNQHHIAMKDYTGEKEFVKMKPLLFKYPQIIFEWLQEQFDQE
jgi:hypothetical protein